MYIPQFGKLDEKRIFSPHPSFPNGAFSPPRTVDICAELAYISHKIYRRLGGHGVFRTRETIKKKHHGSVLAGRVAVSGLF